jgi:hypothetical protein
VREKLKCWLANTKLLAVGINNALEEVAKEPKEMDETKVAHEVWQA